MPDVSFFKIAMSNHHIAHPGKGDVKNYQKWDTKGIFSFALLTIFTGGIAGGIILCTAAAKFRRLNKQVVDAGTGEKVQRMASQAGVTPPQTVTPPETTPIKAPVNKISTAPPPPATTTPLEISIFDKFASRKTDPAIMEKFQREVAEIKGNAQLDVAAKASALKNKSAEAKTKPPGYAVDEAFIPDYYLVEGYLIEAAKLGDANSFLNLAEFYNQRDDGKLSAYHCRLIGAKKGAENADELLGSLVTNGKGFNQDALEDEVFTKIPLLQAVSEQQTCIKIGQFLKYSPLQQQTGVMKDAGEEALAAKNYDEAERFFTAAAKLGDAHSFYFLGQLYRDQCQNNALAYDCFRAGTHLQDPLAAEQLGQLYYNGLGVKKNLAKALECFEQAAPASPEAKKRAEELKAEMAALEKTSLKNAPKKVLISFATNQGVGTPCIIVNTEGFSKSEHDHIAELCQNDENRMEAIQILPGDAYSQAYGVNRGYLIYMKKYDENDPLYQKLGHDPGVSFKKAYENIQKVLKQLKLEQGLDPDALSSLEATLNNCKALSEEAGMTWPELLGEPAYEDAEELLKLLQSQA